MPPIQDVSRCERGYVQQVAERFTGTPPSREGHDGIRGGRVRVGYAAAYGTGVLRTGVDETGAWEGYRIP